MAPPAMRPMLQLWAAAAAASRSQQVTSLSSCRQFAGKPFEHVP